MRKSVYIWARKHQVQNFWPFSLCPVSSMFSTASPGRRSNNSAYAGASASLTLPMSLARYPRETFTRTTSRRNLRIVENEAWQTPFMKATKAVNRGPNSPAFTTVSGSGA